MGLEGSPYSKTNQQKNGSDHTTSGPLFISTTLFDLLVVYPLTLLLIGSPLTDFRKRLVLWTALTISE